MTKIKHPALRYHGSKFRLANWITQFMPPHQCYVEPYGGGAGVLLQKVRSYSEVYNDLDGDITNFFSVLRDPHTRSVLIEQIQLTPYARSEFNLAWSPSNDPIERARRTAIRASMGFGSGGATKGSTGFRIDTRRRGQTPPHLWADYPQVLSDVGQRMSGVFIENRPAIDVMRQHDERTTLHFVDPPYVLDTRISSAGSYYRHEMSDDDHVDLINAVRQLKGMVILCGYPNPLYSDLLSDFESHQTQSRAAAYRGTKLCTEQVWLNPQCAEHVAQQRLFE